MAASAIGYAHYSQIADKERMHAPVLREVAAEAAAKAARAPGAAAPPGAGGAATACESGVCDLATSRFRDPVTGAVTSGALR